MTRGRLGGLTALWLVVAVAGCPGSLFLPAPASAAGVAAPSSEPARIAIDACLKRLNPEIDVGYGRIAVRCPDLARRLQESGWSAWLPSDWKRPGNDLSAGGLRELAGLLVPPGRDAVGSDARPHQMDTAHLSAVLASLAGSGAAERNSWWARTKAWLRDVFERNEEEDDDWFSRVVAEHGLSQAVIELVSYAALALVVVLAGIIVVNELRVDGVVLRLWRRFFGRPRGRATVGSERASDDLSWSDVQHAAPTQRPRLVLELITSRLTAAGRLPQSRGLTILELTRAARLPDPMDRARLAELARLSEHVRFSSGPLSSEIVEGALEGGRLLLSRLERRS